MIDRRIKWPLILALACASLAIAVMVRLLGAELPLEAQQDPAALAARVLAALTDAPAAERDLAGMWVTSDGSVAFWVIAAILALFGFLMAAKSATERIALRRARRRRRDRLTREIEERLAAEAARG
jgi:hypothetical protein